MELTREEQELIVFYILITTKWREGERDAWEKLEKEGVKVAKSNADWFRDLEPRLKAIKDKLDV